MGRTVAVMGTIGSIGKYTIGNSLTRDFYVRALMRAARAHVNDNLTWTHGSPGGTHSLSELVVGASAIAHYAG